jgi:hypothetical protein
VASTCGEMRSTGPVISPGARSGPIAVVTMPCSLSSRVRVATTSAPSGGRKVVIAVGSSTGSTTDHPATPSVSCRVARPSAASRARTRCGPAARWSPTATTSPTRPATCASPDSNARSGGTPSGSGSTGVSCAARRGRTQRTPTPRGPASHLRDGK